MENNIIKTPIISEVEQSFLDYSLSVITDREELLLIDILNIESKRIQLYSIKPDFDDSVGAVAFNMLYGDKIIITVKNEIIM